MNPEPTREELLISLKEANTHHQAALMQLLESENKCLKLMLEVAQLKREKSLRKI
jgi:hypothetical protein